MDKNINKSYGGAAYVINLPELQGGSRCLVYDTDTGRWKGALLHQQVENY